MRRMFVFLGLLASVCWGQQQPVEETPEVATIELAISTTFGGPVGKTVAILEPRHMTSIGSLGMRLNSEKTFRSL